MPPAHIHMGVCVRLLAFFFAIFAQSRQCRHFGANALMAIYPAAIPLCICIFVCVCVCTFKGSWKTQKAILLEFLIVIELWKLLVVGCWHSDVVVASRHCCLV